MSRFLEVEDGLIVVSGNSGVPLMRYGILDKGGVLSYEAMLEAVRSFGFDPHRDLGQRGVRALPFAYIFGRSDFTVSYYGANVFPENVAVGLEQPSVKDWVTGKFVLEVMHGPDENAFLSIVVELAPGVPPDEEKRRAAEASIEAQLCHLNSEYKHYVPPDQRTPRVTLVATADPTYFPLGVKHRYTRQSLPR